MILIKKEYTNESKQQEICTYCPMNKQCVKGGKVLKSLLYERM